MQPALTRHFTNTRLGEQWGYCAFPATPLVTCQVCSWPCSAHGSQANSVVRLVLNVFRPFRCMHVTWWCETASLLLTLWCGYRLPPRSCPQRTQLAPAALWKHITVNRGMFFASVPNAVAPNPWFWRFSDRHFCVGVLCRRLQVL